METLVSRTSGYRCFECNEPAAHAHHIVPFSLGGTRTIPLCETCHGKVHGIDWEGHGALIQAGLKRAVAQGKVLGRPMLNGDIEKKVLALRAKGQGIIKIAKTVGIGVGTVSRMVKA